MDRSRSEYLSPMPEQANTGITMTLQETRLTEEVAITGSHHIALGITAAFKSLVTVEKATLGELANLHAAEVAWKEATAALADYKESQIR
jgi:hypothetical protein